jgi:hypothetical protein
MNFYLLVNLCLQTFSYFWLSLYLLPFSLALLIKVMGEMDGFVGWCDYFLLWACVAIILIGGLLNDII